MKTTSRLFNNLLPALTAVFSLLSSFTATAQELVTNNGFTNGTTGWSTSCSVEIYAETVYGGSSASNNVTEIDVERCLNQYVCIFPGSAYNFGFKATRRISSSTAATVGITVKVTGVQTGTEYVNTNLLYSNTSFNLATQAFSFSIPSNSSDRQVNIEFLNYNNTGTYGVLVDDISLSPAAALGLVGPDAATVNIGSDFSVSNAPASGIDYSWNFGSGASTPTSSSAAPNVTWTTNGNKPVTVGLGNGSCTVALLGKSVAVSSILPVKLISFSGSYNKQIVDLNWVAEDENNEGKYFIIERAAQSGFDSIGKIAVAATAGAIKYSFADTKAAAGVNKYRLKQIDQNGTFVYSKIIAVTVAAAQSMQVYPNPAIATLSYKISSDLNQDVDFQVYSVSGRLAFSKKQRLVAGVNGGSLDISSLQPGAYFLRAASVADTNFVQAFSKK